MRASTNPYFITGGKSILEKKQMEEENLDAVEQTTWQHMNEQEQLTIVGPENFVWGAYGHFNHNGSRNRPDPYDSIIHIGVAGFCRILMHRKPVMGSSMGVIIEGFLGSSPIRYHYQRLEQEVQELNEVWLHGNATENTSLTQQRRQLVELAYTLTSDDDETKRNFKKLSEWIIEDTDHGFKVRPM